MAKTPQEEGRHWERRFAKLLGADLVPGSGSQWFAKLDVNDRTILWGLKWSKDSFKITKGILREVIKHATKIGSSNSIPGWGFEIGGEDFVLLRANDFVALFEDGNYVIEPLASAQKRARSKVPLILRDKESEE
jgi:hypothetical protein